MSVVREHLDVFPFTAPARVLVRDERHLLERARPGRLGQLWNDVPPVDVVHFDQPYVQQPFAPPRFLYDGPHGRLEWQQMDNRQPIYHRNLDVDEMSYQIDGERTLITELGTAELRAGDFVRVPAGVCHDNWGRRESHLLWYLPEPCEEQLAPARTSEYAVPPFAGWEPAVVNEVVTDCLGSGPHDTSAHRADERLLLDHAATTDERLAVIAPREAGPARAPLWIWKGPTAWVGVVDSGPDAGRDYVRHRNADEIQYQVSGERLLVTQHGSVEIGPGDVVRLPIGVAFTSVVPRSSRHITTLSRYRMPRVHPAARTSEPWTPARIEEFRSDVLDPVHDPAV